MTRTLIPAVKEAVTVRLCVSCSAPIPPALGRGRPRKYCEACANTHKPSELRRVCAWCLGGFSMLTKVVDPRSPGYCSEGCRSRARNARSLKGVPGPLRARLTSVCTCGCGKPTARSDGFIYGHNPYCDKGHLKAQAYGQKVCMECRRTWARAAYARGVGATPCDCGCGEMVGRGSAYKQGHRPRVTPTYHYRPNTPIYPCRCGCGELCHHPQAYRLGHRPKPTHCARGHELVAWGRNAEGKCILCVRADNARRKARDRTEARALTMLLAEMGMPPLGKSYSHAARRRIWRAVQERYGGGGGSR